MNHIINAQKEFFLTNTTKKIAFRIKQLKKLKQILQENEPLLYKAIQADFKKSEFETYTSEIGLLYAEIEEACKKTKKWARYKRVKTNRLNIPSKSFIVPEPLGVCLVIGAWNYPYLLSLAPVVAAIAAGNTIILKPSELPIQTSNVIAKLINRNFDASFFKVIEGGIPETTALLKCKFDKIFFTGSVAVGKIVHLAAAKNMTPVTLELGGKSPVIITENCHLKIIIKRLIWAKFLNAGQTCIAPDYVYIHESLQKTFLKQAKTAIIESNYSFKNENYVQIINTKNFNRLIALIDKNKVVIGGDYDEKTRYISPTIVSDVTFEDTIMQEEIFGPILPILTYRNLEDVIAKIKSKPKPLACYLATNSKKIKRKILNEISFGSGAINDSVMQITNNNLPFGGVGESGMGSYHGEFGFKTFSHYKSIIDKKTWIEPNLKYHPYSNKKLRIIKILQNGIGKFKRKKET